MAAKPTYPLGLRSRKEPVPLPKRKDPALLDAPATKPPETGPRLVPVPWDESFYVVYGIEPPPLPGGFTLVLGTSIGIEADITWVQSNPPPPSYILQFFATANGVQVFEKLQGPDLILNIEDPLDWQILCYIRPPDTTGLSPGDVLYCWVQAISGIDVWMLAYWNVTLTGPGGALQSNRQRLRRYSLQLNPD